MKKVLGFTLIEMLVVIGIIAIALPAAFAIIFAIIRQQARVYALKQVKREGDFVLNKMADNIRNNAVGIFTSSDLSTEVCDQAGAFPKRYPPDAPDESASDDGSHFYFEDKFGNLFRYYNYYNTQAPDYFIASESAVSSAISTVNLTTSAVQVPHFYLSCTRSAPFSPPVVSISFNITYASDFQEQFATLYYQTQIGMRNY